MPIRIKTNHRKQFWRCGVQHQPDWVEHPIDRFTPDELEKLQNEPRLDVVIVPDDDGVIAKTKALKKMKVEKLKALLDKLKVDYPPEAKKDDLIALVEKSTAEPPREA